MVCMKSSISFGFMGAPNDANAIISIKSTFSPLRFIDTNSFQPLGQRVNLLVGASRPASVAVLCGTEGRPHGGQMVRGVTVPEEAGARKQVTLRFAVDDSALQREAGERISQS